MYGGRDESIQNGQAFGFLFKVVTTQIYAVKTRCQFLQAEATVAIEQFHFVNNLICIMGSKQPWIKKLSAQVIFGDVDKI